MIKLRVLSYMIIAIIIIVVGILIFNNVAHGDKQNQKEKLSAEIKYVESKLVNLMNTLNNIKDESYSISASKISAQSKNAASESSTTSDEGTKGDSKDELGGKQQEGYESSSETSKENSSNASLNTAESNNKVDNRFILKSDGVLANKENINWDNVKNEIEELYISTPTITIDLYNQNVKQEDILNFNRQVDNLAIVAKDEKKLETLSELSKLYDCIPIFMQIENELYSTIIETKSYIFKAYSKLDTDNWNDISADIQNALNIYSKLLTNPNIELNKKYNINKSYIMLNELRNATKIQDISIFLIKYKNIIEELNNI